MPRFSRLLAVFAALSLASASSVAHAHDEDEGEHHHHGVVIQPRNFDHAVDLVRDGLKTIGEAVARGDMHALHELSDGVAVPARALGKLAAARPGAAAANIRAINTLGQDLAKLVDAMHVAADSSRAEVVVAKWKEIEGMMPQLDAVSPVPVVNVSWTALAGSGGRKSAFAPQPGEFVLTMKDNAGELLELPDQASPMHLIVVSEGFEWFSHLLPDRRAAGEYTAAFTAPSYGGQFTAFAILPVPGRMEPLTHRQTLSISGGSAPDITGPLNHSEPSQIVGDYLVRMTGADHVHAGDVASLVFMIDQTSNPGGVLTEDYLGMPAFFSAISADRQRLVLASAVESAGRGEIRVSAVFPREGKHVARIEFKHAGKVTTVPFVIEVHSDH